MARLQGGTGSSSSSNNTNKSKTKTRSGQKLLQALEMEVLDEGDEDESEYFLPSNSKKHTKKQKGYGGRYNNNNNRRRKSRFRDDENDDDDDDDDFHDEDADYSSSSSCLSRCTNYQKKVLLVVFVLVGFGVLYLTEMDRIVVTFGQVKDGVGGLMNGSNRNGNGKSGGGGGIESVVEKSTQQQIDFHGQESSTEFGGINNVAHPGGAQAASKGEGRAYDTSIVIPVSNVGHAIPSMNRPNFLNLWGHYVHDEHRSPYASHLYYASQKTLDERQVKYETKLQKVRDTWGYWNFKDPLKMNDGDETTTSTNLDDDGIRYHRPVADFSNVDYKDLNTDEFPTDAWQADTEYIAAFLLEAQALVGRMKEGIYTEYGHPAKDLKPDSDELKQHTAMWKMRIFDTDEEGKNCTTTQDDYVFDVECGPQQKDSGLATFHVNAWTGFVKKLLHSMMTNDEFYVVLGGHSAAAGHGNNFQQNRIIHGFHHIMEPVMDKLGIRLISRNMGMGGVGTLQFSLGGGDMYGEADLIEWDSGMTEGGPAVDLFYKQAILSGERVPLLLIPGGKGHPFNLFEETQGKVILGELLPANDKTITAPDTTYENAASKPYASRWFNQKEEKFNAICWEPRADFTPGRKQAAVPTSQVGWHPGNRQHTWSGRKVALIVLEGLQHALQIWEQELIRTTSSTTTGKDGDDKGRRKTATDQEETTTADEEGDNTGDGDNNDKEEEEEEEGGGCCPLAAKHWHVGDMYKEIRQNLRTHITTPKESGDDIRSDCEKLIPYLPRICRVQMHAFGMWTPRASAEYDFLNIIHEAPNGYKPPFLERNIYDGFDLLPLKQELGDDDVDVHAIAIATSNPPPDIDHSWIEDDDETSNATTSIDNNETEVTTTTEKPPSRRELRRASTHAFRKGSELAVTPTTTRNSNEEKSSIVNSNNRSQPQQRNLIRTSSRTNRKLQSDDNSEGGDVDTDGEESNEDENTATKRTYGENDIVPGRGWVTHGWFPCEGFCDGSPQSECGRQEGNNCLMSGTNDKHWDVIGSPMSGWLVFTLPNVREGIILLRMEWWCGSNNGNALTAQWTEVNGGKTLDTTPWNTTRELAFQKRRLSHEDLYEDDNERNLKATIPPAPDDFFFDYVINNGETNTMDKKEFETHQVEYVKNVAVWPVLNDESMSENYDDDDGKLNPVEVAIRFRSESNPLFEICVSHVYYA